jgi:hypothetical protein
MRGHVGGVLTGESAASLADCRPNRVNDVSLSHVD